MTSLRWIVPFSLLVAACNPDAPAQPASSPAPAPAAKPPGSLPPDRLPPGDPHAQPPPDEELPIPEGVPAAQGKLDAMIEGKPAHFVRLPAGQNRAVVLPDGAGRVRIEGSEDEKTGMPHLRVILEGVRPDRVTYPITIASKPKDGEPKGPWASIRYEVNDQRIYLIDPAKGAEAQVTLEGWEGTTLRGRFAGKLAPTAASLGAPIPISGEFAVTLGLDDGIQPGPAAADAEAPAAKAD